MSEPKKQRRGFAAMSPEQQRAISAKGGKIAHLKGVAHRWTPAEAKKYGKQGGLAGGRGRWEKAV